MEDQFWVGNRYQNVGQWFATTRPGGDIGREVIDESMATTYGATRYSVSAALASGYTMRIEKPLLSHPKNRMSAHPGGPKLRAPGKPYKPTGFKAAIPKIDMRAGVRALPFRSVVSKVKMPANFCYKPSDLTTPHDQGQCGSCWACAIAHFMADRVAIHTNGDTKVPLSVRHIMECADYSTISTQNGCSGNDPFTALKSIQDRPINVAANEAYPRKYDMSWSSDPESGVSHNDCPDARLLGDAYGVTVKNVARLTKTFNVVGDPDHAETIENIKQTIYNEGPVYAIIDYFSDFADYDGLTIYEPGPDAVKTGAHAIEMIGWGVDPDSKAEYWVCRNSWGDKWPAHRKPDMGVGYFYIKLGDNTCGIEEAAACATPVVVNGGFGSGAGVSNKTYKIIGASLILAIVVGAVAYVYVKRR